MASFEELKKTWRFKKELLDRFAKARKSTIVESKSYDGWDIMLQFVELKNWYSPKGVMYTSVGSTYPEAYDELLTMVMRSNGWSTAEEIEVWLDLNGRLSQ